ncbi:MAG: hypothetical protein QM778_02475 [Myxococcales bacterium]
MHPRSLRAALQAIRLLVCCEGCGDSNSGDQHQHDAGQDAARADAGFTDCDIDELTGTVLVAYVRLDGTCGDLPPQTYNLAKGAWWHPPGCTANSTATSADQCTSTGSSHCELINLTTEISGMLTQLSPVVVSGTVHFESAGQDSPPCEGHYTISYMLVQD